ncbi:hypothetical protein BJY04DRAFT_221796 [Aspergillus karnatakaensis]|uniref:uncharacterized protein n=1 Tax=Aspergillus karnatakaensis TaxID=1810916 RepID=UPI003CCD20D1
MAKDPRRNMDTRHRRMRDVLPASDTQRRALLSRDGPCVLHLAACVHRERAPDAHGMEEALRKAWTTMWSAHPTLASGLTEILTRCKAIGPGVGVTHVFMTALAVAPASLQPEKEDEAGDAPYVTRYVNHSMMNLRPFCQTPYDSLAHAAVAYHTISAQALATAVEVPATSSAQENVAKARTQL